MEEAKEKLYPILNSSAPPLYENTQDYRIKHIKDIQKYLEMNKEMRKKISKKYSKINNGLHLTNYGVTAISTSTGIAGISLLSTVAAISIAIILERVAIGTGIFSILLIKIHTKFKVKEQKHRDIYNLCEMKLNTINSLLSKILQDNNITNEEFQLILKEEEHFQTTKEEIRKNKNKKYEMIEKGLKDKIVALIKKS